MRAWNGVNWQKWSSVANLIFQKLFETSSLAQHLQPLTKCSDQWNQKHAEYLLHKEVWLTKYSRWPWIKEFNVSEPHLQVKLHVTTKIRTNEASRNCMVLCHNIFQLPAVRAPILPWRKVSRIIQLPYLIIYMTSCPPSRLFFLAPSSTASYNTCSDKSMWVGALASPISFLCWYNYRVHVDAYMNGTRLSIACSVPRRHV
jgi:hypothetical protein